METAARSTMQTQLVPTAIGLRRGMLPLQRPRSLSPSTRQVQSTAAKGANTQGYSSEAVMEAVAPALQGALDALLRDIELKGRVPAVPERRGRRRSSAGAAVPPPITKATPIEQAEGLRFLAQWLLRNKESVGARV